MEKTDRHAFRTGCAALVLAFQFAVGLLLIGRNAEPFSVAAGVRNDSSTAIGTVQRSTWWEHNGYGQYGPLYFRVCWTLDKASPLLAKGSPWKWGEPRQTHYNMMMQAVSWLSLFGLCATLASSLSRDPFRVLAGTSLLVTAFCVDRAWAMLVVVPRPDLFLAFLAALATRVSLGLLPESGLGDRRLLALSAVLWGLAMATKLSALVYLAVWPLLFLAWPIHRRILPGLAFLLIVLLVYAAVGFPQTIDLPYLKHYVPVMAASNEAPTGTMPDMRWGHRLLWQGGPPLLALFFLAALWREPRARPWRAWDIARALAFAVFPIAYMFTKRVASPSDHYLMPYIASALAVAAALSLALPARLRLPRRVSEHPAFHAALLLLALGLPRVLPSGLAAFSAEQVAANQQALVQLDEVRALQASGRRVYVDPYVPHDPQVGKVHWTFRAHMGMLAKEGPDILVLRRFYYQRYLTDEPDYYLRYFFWNSWQNSREFYRFLQDKDRVVAPDGRAWTLEKRKGLEIWRAEAAP
jgi:hypothetical protein